MGGGIASDHGKKKRRRGKGSIKRRGELNSKRINIHYWIWEKAGVNNKKIPLVKEEERMK